MIEQILEKENLTKDDLIYLMKLTKQDDLNKLYEKAYSIKE